MEGRGKIIGLIAALFASLLLSGCGAGTETGNPQQLEDALQGGQEGGEESYLTYSNDDFGIELSYPAGWTYQVTEETTENLSIAFNGIETEQSTVNISVYILNEEPVSLADYLATTRPGVAFEEYSNDYESGYIYDSTEDGPNGGDIKEIYFLEGSTLIHIVAELFDADGGVTNAEVILSTIRFTG